MGGEAGCSGIILLPEHLGSRRLQALPRPPSPAYAQTAREPFPFLQVKGLWVWGTGGITGEADKVSSVREFAWPIALTKPGSSYFSIPQLCSQLQQLKGKRTPMSKLGRGKAVQELCMQTQGQPGNRSLLCHQGHHVELGGLCPVQDGGEVEQHPGLLSPSCHPWAST